MEKSDGRVNPGSPASRRYRVTSANGAHCRRTLIPASTKVSRLCQRRNGSGTLRCQGSPASSAAASLATRTTCGWRNRGLGLKVSDEFAMPLCRAHHWSCTGRPGSRPSSQGRPRQQRFRIRIVARGYLGCALLVTTMGPSRARKAMPHHEPQDAFAFGALKSLHGVAPNHRRDLANGPFNLASTALVSAHVQPLIGEQNA
jgi:hypothetical protein